VKRPWTVITFIAILTALSGCASQASSAKSSGGSLMDEIRQRGVVRVGVRVDNPPHSLIDAKGAWVGFDVDIARAIAERWKVKLELVRVDELTRISFLENGRIDLAVASISKTKKRADKVDFSETYFFSKQTFLVQKGEIATLRDLVGKRVGADRGSSGAGNWRDWLQAHGHSGDPQIVLFGDKHAAVDAVKQGAIAGWAEDYEVLASYAKNEPGLTIVNDPGGIGVKLDGIAMRKNDSKLLLGVNLALQDIAAAGAYDRIYDRWFGPSSPAPVPLQGRIEVWPNG
jgi:polar amino acid transport system substrate-binding protein